MTENDGSNPAPFLERPVDDISQRAEIRRQRAALLRKKRIALAIGKLFAARKCPTFGEIADVAIGEYEREM